MDSEPTITLEEADAAEEALAEFEATGATERKCLRCGGEYVFEIFGASYRVSCKSCEFKMTVRGI